MSVARAVVPRKGRYDGIRLSPNRSHAGGIPGPRPAVNGAACDHPGGSMRWHGCLGSAQDHPVRRPVRRPGRRAEQACRRADRRACPDAVDAQLRAPAAADRSRAFRPRARSGPSTSAVGCCDVLESAQTVRRRGALSHIRRAPKHMRPTVRPKHPHGRNGGHAHAGPELRDRRPPGAVADHCPPEDHNRPG